MRSTPQLAQSFLCAGEPNKLADSAARLTGIARRRLNHFLWVARHHEEFPAYQIQHLGAVPEGLARPMCRPDESAYCFLAYLLTGDEYFASAGKRRLLQLADTVAVRETGTWTQMHTWCDSFPFARWILLSDWIWDAPVLTAEEKTQVQERYLYYLWAHPYQRLLARPLAGTPCNNQNAAMALACVIGGYLFGVKRDDNVRARQLLSLGLPHLIKFATAFPQGGYSFEGSNYMAGVNAFLLPFAIDLIEAVSGMDVLDVREDAHCASPREVLQAIMRLTTPQGLTLPWDCAGYSRAEFTHAAAYLAFRTGDHAPLDFLDSLGEWERPSHTGWGFDKTLWTLLWSLRAAELPLPHPSTQWTLNHAEPGIGAGAAGPAGRLFHFQMWDRNHWPPGRAQFNPNSIILTYDGSPLLLDGQCVESAKAGKFAQQDCYFHRHDIQAEDNFGIGTVGAHNALIFDGEEHFAPRGSPEGRLCHSHYGPGVTLFESEASDCYRERYDAQSLRRASLILGDHWVLVRDRIECLSPHKITWRAHTRSGPVQSAPGYFAVATPEAVRLEICTPGVDPIEHHTYPIEHRNSPGPSTSATPREDRAGAVLAVNILEGRCHEVSHHAEGQSLTLFTLLVPTNELQEWRKLDAPWQWLATDTQEQVEAALKAWPGGQLVDFSNAPWFHTSERHEPGFGLYRRTFDIPESPPESVWIELPRLVRNSRIRINGKDFSVVLAHEELPLLPHRIMIGDSLKLGTNSIEIVVPSTLEWTLRGQIRLLVPAPTSERARLTQKDAATLEIHHHGLKDLVQWNDEECLITRSDGSTVQILLGSKPEPKVPNHSMNRICDLLIKSAEFKSDPSHSILPLNKLAILAAIEGNDWRVALEALEKIPGDADKEVIESVHALLQREYHTHPTPPARDPQDVCWYRLKAAAARVLGRARFEPATELLGTLLIGTDIYPVRVASAWALGQIGTPQAVGFLNQIPSNDEWNTVAETKSALSKFQNQRPDISNIPCEGRDPPTD